MKHLYDILLCPPDLRGNERAFIDQCIEDAWISTNGPFVDDLEKQFSDLLNRDFAIATASGTAALELCLSGCGVGRDDYVIIPDWTFSATVNAALHIGAIPFLADIGRENWSLDPEDLDRSIKALGKQGIRPKAVVAVHPPGQAAPMREIKDICATNNIFLIEDAAGALGTYYDGTPLGAFGDLAAFSFNGNKIITASSGGMVVTDNKEFAERIKLTSVNSHGPNYTYVCPGNNYRMSNICAAIGLAQMERFDEILGSKRRISDRYDEALKYLPIFEIAPRAPKDFSNHWMYCALLDCEDRAQSLIYYMEQKRIQIRVFWRSLSSEQAFADLPRSEVKNSREISGRLVALPCGSGLTPDQQETVVEELKNWALTQS